MDMKERMLKTVANREAKQELKARLAPRMLWHSKTQGTYCRKKHGPLRGHR